LNETPEQKNARYLKEHGINPEQAKAEQEKAKAEAAKAEEGAKAAAAGKAGSKQADKALPKTSAVK
jgi:amylase-binding protein abpA